jgi:hypothetical protein
MTVPPQGPYGSQPPSDGGPQWGGPPPQGPGAQPPYGGAGQPQYGQQPGGGPWPQQGWTGAPPSPNSGGKGKWILIGLALVAIIAVSIVGTVLVLRPDSGGGNGSSNTAAGASEFASANDTGPANIITEDPTCEAWTKISRDVSAAVPEWNKQDYKVPATEWTPAQRAVFEQKSAALKAANEKVANLGKQTPHRVMRELYGQYIAYAQAVISAIPNYSATDNFIVATSNKFSSTLNEVCKAIHYHAAQETAPLIPEPSPPSDGTAAKISDGREPERFVAGDTGKCGDWIAMAEQFDKDSEAWRSLDLKVSAAEWTPEQKSVVDAATPVLTAYAEDMERLGRESGDQAWEDFAVLAAQSMRAYVQSIPTYTSNIGYMVSQSTYLANAIYWACKAES